MQVITRIAELRERLGQNGSQGKPTSATHAQQTVAFVPTMGNLHAGHISLIQQARPLATTVVASIFVNRLQFAPNEDFDRYPRTFDADCEGLKAAGADVLFFPEERELYPEPQGFVVQPPAIGQMLEERFRPGFFRGVSTVVLKLFNLVQPQIAIFGKKDYQQLRVIEALVRQLALPIQIIAAETGRDHDGLALSSRNVYLSPAERAEAPRLYQTLQAMQQRIRGGERNFLGARRLGTDEADIPDVGARRIGEDPRAGKRHELQIDAQTIGNGSCHVGGHTGVLTGGILA